MQLPTAKTKPKTDFAKMNTLIFSNPKVGKSTFCSQIPGALFAPTEEGLNYLEVNRVPLITKWSEILYLGQLLSKEPHDFKTVVVDTVDQLYQRAEEYICQVEGVKKVADIPMGAGYGMVKKEFIRVMTRFNSLGLGLVFTSHSKLREVKTKTLTYTMMDTSLSPGASQAICGFMDHILYAYIDEKGQRLLRTKPTKYINAGDRSGKLPEVMQFSYDVFINHFNSAVKGKDEKNS